MISEVDEAITAGERTTSGRRREDDGMVMGRGTGRPEPERGSTGGGPARRRTSRGDGVRVPLVRRSVREGAAMAALVGDTLPRVRSGRCGGEPEAGA